MFKELDETVSALSKSVHNLDASRRVGWAKAYDAQEAREEAERLAELAKVDRDDLRKMVSFLYGYVTEFADGIGYSPAGQNVGSYLKFCGVHLVEDAKARSGRTAARADLKAWVGRDERVKSLKREHRDRRRAQRHFRDKWIAQLAQSHGFESTKELLAHLRWYRRVGRFMEGLTDTNGGE